MNKQEDRLKLVSPSLDYKEEILAYKQEFIENGDSLDGGAWLEEAESVESWLADLSRNSSAETVKPGLVPASTYLAVRQDDSRLVGLVDIRHCLNDFLLNFGGHIGYSVRRAERRKGYGREILALALEKCRELKIDKVLITCNQENIGSRKIIQANGGVLENRVANNDVTTERYWIQS